MSFSTSISVPTVVRRSAMDDHQLKCLELLEKLKMEIEHGIRHEIELELRQKFEKELEEKLLKNELAYEAKLKVIKKEVKDMKEKMGKVDVLFNKLHEETMLDEAAAEKNTPEELPPILQSVYERFLQNIVNYLDPSSFMSLTQTSKKLHSLASNGSLRVPVELYCLTFMHYNSCFDDPDHDTGKTLMLLQKDKLLGSLTPLTFKKVTSLNKMPCFRPIIRALNLEKFPNCGERMREILDFIRVERIDEACIEVEPNVEDLIKRYKFGELRLRNLTSKSFLYSPYINRIKKLDLHFKRNFDITILPAFIRSTRIPLAIQNPMPSSLAFELVQSWLKSKERFTSTYFRFEATRPYNHDLYNRLRSMLSSKCVQHYIDAEIRLFPIESVRELNIPIVPSVLVGNDRSMVVIRSDTEMLRINTFGDSIGLNKMDDEEFAFLRSLRPVAVDAN